MAFHYIPGVGYQDPDDPQTIPGTAAYIARHEAARAAAAAAASGAAAPPIAGGEEWRDMSASRSTGPFYHLDATRAVMVNWTFTNLVTPDTAISIAVRIAPTDTSVTPHVADWQNSVYVYQESLAHTDEHKVFTGIVPPDHWIQTISTGGLALAHAMELTL